MQLELTNIKPMSQVPQLQGKKARLPLPHTCHSLHNTMGMSLISILMIITIIKRGRYNHPCMIIIIKVEDLEVYPRAAFPKCVTCIWFQRGFDQFSPILARSNQCNYLVFQPCNYSSSFRPLETMLVPSNQCTTSTRMPSLTEICFPIRQDKIACIQIFTKPVLARFFHLLSGCQ